MDIWFWRRPRARVDAPRLRPRSFDAAHATKVDLAELTPSREQFLGHASYVQMAIYEELARVVATAPTIEAKVAISDAVSVSLERYTQLAAEIRRTGEEPGAIMAPYRSAIDFFQRATEGSSWAESLMTCHIAAGILDDFFERLAAGLPADSAQRVGAIYADSGHEAILTEQLALVISADPKMAARLAMWGRRLVGDSMLVARSSLATPPSSATDEARIEPVFTELIAAHTRRMDALGLTA